MSIVTDLNLLRRQLALEGKPMPSAYFIPEAECAEAAAELWKMNKEAGGLGLTVQQVTRSLLGQGVRFMGTRIVVAKVDREDGK